MVEDSDAKSFVHRSSYRMEVIRSLAKSGSQTPTAIAEKTDIRQPHVSRALSKLRQRNLVELTVPESQHKGRLYQLTTRGEEIWADVKPFNWQGPTDCVPDAHRSVICYLRHELGEHFLLAGYYDGSDINNYYICEDVEYSEAVLESTVKRLVEDFSHRETNVSGMAGDLLFECQLFTDLHRIVMYTEDGFFAVGTDPECRFEVPTLVKHCMTILQQDEELSQFKS